MQTAALVIASIIAALLLGPLIAPADIPDYSAAAMIQSELGASSG